MNGGKKMRTSIFTLYVALFLAVIAAASDSPEITPVEHESQWWPKGQGGSLGTIHYRPSKKEQLFFNRLPADEVATGSHFDSYDISTKHKKYVGWFGIVRKIAEDAKTNRTVLTIEHKYFDGLTDTHLQSVSFNGSGDFQAALTGTAHRIPPLSLVKVYGNVAEGKAGDLPRIEGEFVRNWHWGTFTFLAAYGKQHGSEEWRKANQILLDRIYEAWPHPCHHYYEERLGKRPDAPEIRERLIDAAGPLSREALRAIERLADLLAVGHTWSQGETMRQSEELAEIRKLVQKTGSSTAVVKLLLQALHENDERVSWSASEKFAGFDLTGDAIEAVVKLLDHESLRVRAGAARALSSGYGAKAAPAVAALGRCVAVAHTELKEYAVLALHDIGPPAKAAIPALTNALSDEDPAARVRAAKAIWRIDGQTDDVIPVFSAVLENGTAEERYEAAEQFKELGPWAASAVPALIKALEDKEWTNRCNVAEALGAIGPNAAAAVPALTGALKSDENSFVRSNVAEALGKIGDPQAVAVLIEVLEGEDDSVRFNAVEALEAFGHKAQAAVPALMRVVKNEQGNAWSAAHALGAIDAQGISTPALIEALGSQDPTMRRFAAYGLGRIGHKAAAAEKALHDSLRDSDPGARIAAAAAYSSVSGKADDSVGVLRSILQAAGSWQTQMWAADALAETGPPAKAAVPELIACLKSDTQYVVTSSAKALGKIGPDAASAMPALTARLEDADDDYTRVCLAHAQWRINRSDKSLPVLQDALKNSNDSSAVSEAAEAIGERGPEGISSVPLLRPLLKDGNSFVRDAASKALKQIEPK